MSAEPYQLERWDLGWVPEADLLGRGLARDGLKAGSHQLAPGAASGERQETLVLTIVAVTGKLTAAFPGYGSVTLSPGDRLDIASGVRFEITADDGAICWLEGRPPESSSSSSSSEDGSSAAASA